MTFNNKTNRRDFIKNAFLAISAAGVSLKIIPSEDVFAQTAAIDESNPTALALGYKHDANTVDTTKFPKRAGDQGKKQLCANCMFYNQGGQKIAAKDGSWGKCTIFPTGLVNEQGWCNTWSLKPGATL